MFTIHTDYSDQFEVETSIERVREFFFDIRNFIELMPNVESITQNDDETMRWTIRADIPIVGSMRQTFNVELADRSDERVEWIPRRGETQNFLRYAADFVEKNAAVTLVRFSQKVELRRRKAKEFHLLAGLAGEANISKGMQWEVAGMMKNFVEKAKQKLERS